jgi:methylmalonyl-CoA mutase
MPVFGTIASQFNDPGTNQLYVQIMRVLHEKTNTPLESHFAATDEMSEKIYIIPPDRIRYLAEISEENDRYEKWVKEQAQLATTLYNLEGTIGHLKTLDVSHAAGAETLAGLREDVRIPKIALPRFKDWGEILRWCLQENVPGDFPTRQACSRSSERAKTHAHVRWRRRP